MAMNCRELDNRTAESVRRWTFPAYRHLLDLQPSVRHPSRSDRRRVQPLAFAAYEDGRPKGLVLGCVPAADADPTVELPNEPEMLSLYVAPSARHQGVGGELVRKLEEAVSRAEMARLGAVYMTGAPEIEFLEKLLAHRHWSPPEVRMLVLKGTLQEIQRAPWYGRYDRREGFVFFPWSEVRPADLARIEESHRRTAWIAEDLTPWQYDLEALETASSIGIRLEGEIVGWVINHRMSDETVRFTCSFIRADLARRARILSAYSESIRRADEAGFRRTLFTVPAHHRPMTVFARRWCAPWLSYQGETRGSVKDLAGPAGGA